MKNVYIQQGDVILHREKSIPKGAKKVNILNNTYIIEKGEGVNTHELQHKQLAKAVQIYETEKKCYLQVVAPLVLVHQEHGTAQIGGRVLLSKQKEREWDYETQESRNVLD